MSRMGRMRASPMVPSGELSERGHDPLEMSPLYNANYGRQQTMNHHAVPGGFLVDPTTLIADVHVGQNEWMVTLLTLTRTDAQVVPWQDMFAGTAHPPQSTPPGSNFQAPVVPALGFQVLLRWAAGGATAYAAFDYPANGAVFGIACETLNLDVGLKPGQSPVTYGAQAQIPVIGAMMTEGAPATQRPLRWADVTATIGLSPGTSTAYWPVRPYARKMDLYTGNENSAASFFTVTWLTANGVAALGTGIEQTIDVAPANTGTVTTIDVPPNALAVEVSYSGSTPVTVVPVWEISFA